MAIVVTGATGFLGSRLLAQFLQQPEPVIALTNKKSGDGWEDLCTELRAIGHPEPAPGQLTAIGVNMTQSHLGLSRADWHDLAEQAGTVWHGAASTYLGPQRRAVRRANINGTRNVLELAAAAPRRPRLFHISTAFVAGKRTSGTVGEHSLSAACGFENPYEESKYEAELIVGNWAREHERETTIFRPSILATDQYSPGSRRPNPLQSMMGIAGDLVPVRAGTARRFPFRVPGSADAYMNIMPVETAVQQMIELSLRPARSLVQTFHIVHPHEVPVPVLVELFESAFPVRIELVSARPADPSPLEALLYDKLGGFMPYLFHHRTYDRACSDEAGLRLAPADPLDLAYFQRGLLAPAPQLVS
jgi:thioester reductase-like protein